MTRQLIISFKGNREEIHEQFKKYCEDNGYTMTGKIIELIKKTLKQGEGEKTFTS